MGHDNDRLDQLVDTDPLALRDEAYALMARAEKAEAERGQLRTTIEVLLLNHHHELLKPPGEQDPDIAELAHVYQHLTGWDALTEIAQDRAALDQPTEPT